MTCIVAIAKDGKVTMGADSGEFKGYNVYMCTKIFRVGELLVGGAGDAAGCDAIKFRARQPKHLKWMDDDTYMHVAVVPEMKRALKEAGLLSGAHGVESMNGISLMIGYHGTIYTISEDGYVHRSFEKFEADGIGEPYARGHLIATESEPDTEKRIRDALRAAEICNAFVRGPFVVASSEDEYVDPRPPMKKAKRKASKKKEKDVDKKKSKS